MTPGDRRPVIRKAADAWRGPLPCDLQNATSRSISQKLASPPIAYGGTWPSHSDGRALSKRVASAATVSTAPHEEQVIESHEDVLDPEHGVGPDDLERPRRKLTKKPATGSSVRR